jgi:hypothetical protein
MHILTFQGYLASTNDPMGCWHGRVDQFWHHNGIFSAMGVIASAISYYI